MITLCRESLVFNFFLILALGSAFFFKFLFKEKICQRWF